MTMLVMALPKTVPPTPRPEVTPVASAEAQAPAMSSEPCRPRPLDFSLAASAAFLATRAPDRSVSWSSGAAPAEGAVAV
ncbi:hypothetical protein DUY81_11730 [Acidipropionibacterium acidipropionici]|nr:hypothetical protein DUY81_11730 [Acidipropionibacterium acidipropionici]QCV95320.1 hypothetical protein FEZ30_08640 [Acidipropionibacterium acidipropionici]